MVNQEVIRSCCRSGISCLFSNKSSGTVPSGPAEGIRTYSESKSCKKVPEKIEAYFEAQLSGCTLFDRLVQQPDSNVQV